MVTNVTSLTGNGLKDWLIQRVTAVYLVIFLASWLGYFLYHPHMEYNHWRTLFQCQWVQITTIIGIIAIVLHAWIGIWTITTDYLKCTALRLSIQLLVLFGLLAEVLWGIKILWGQ